MTTKLNFVLNQGDDFSQQLLLSADDGTPIDLSTYTATSEMRVNFDSNTAYSFTVSLGANGSITMTMPASNTAVLDPGRYVYDVELTDTANTVTRILQGIVDVIPNVTR